MLCVDDDNMGSRMRGNDENLGFCRRPYLAESDGELRKYALLQEAGI